MIQILHGTNIPFMKYRRFAYMISSAVVLATAVWLVMHRGPRQGVDFSGGTLLQIRASRVLPADQLRSALDQGGLLGAELQQITGEGAEYMVRLQAGEGDLFASVQRAVHAKFPDVQLELRRTETVGPKVGKELGQKAIWAILGSL